MKRTVIDIPKMDCASEEQIIRMSLEPIEQIKKLSFDLKERQLTVVHDEDSEGILSALIPLGFGAKLRSTDEVSPLDANSSPSFDPTVQAESSVLKRVFFVNAVMFLVGIVGGIIAQSTGLISDSLDMFADAAVFALSFYSIGKPLFMKKRAAFISGILQLTLASGALLEVVRKFIYGSDPRSDMMIGLAFLALLANAYCLKTLSAHKDGEVHMRASWIFLSNDVIVNMGVIIAGVLVHFTSSRYPDLVIGAVVATVVLRGSFKIIRLAR